MRINFTFHWSRHDGIEQKSVIGATNLARASEDFHAIVQLQHGVDRDAYKIEKVVTDHRTQFSEKSPPTGTPQTYLGSELPPRNPDAKKFVLTDTDKKRLGLEINDPAPAK
ncbi:MAG: hypothetical protein NVV63_12720 [Opitutus sp.]|nr:hypothetical protein [Opitutus sp.]